MFIFPYGISVIYHPSWAWEAELRMGGKSKGTHPLYELNTKYYNVM